MRSKLFFLISFFLGLSLVVRCSAAGSDPGEDLIRQIYKNHQPAKRMSILTSKETLSKYFDAEMTRLLIKDQDCGVSSDSVCNSEMDPIYNAQEFSASDIQLKIKKQTTSGTSETFEVTFDNLGPMKLIYHLSKTGDGWRVSDIVNGEGHSLRKSLSEKTE